MTDLKTDLRSTPSWWTLILLLWLAAALRWVGLMNQSISFDESFSLVVGQANWPIFFQALLSDGIHPPFFYVVHKIALATMGTTEFGQRFLVAVFSVLAVALIYRTGRLLFNPTVGLLAALLLALSPVQVWLAQDARMYGLFTALSITSMMLFWQAVRFGRRRDWVALAITNAVLFLTHYFGFLIATVQFLFLVLTFSRNYSRLRPWTLVQFAAVLPILPWLVVTALRPVRSFAIGALVRPSLSDLFITYWNLGTGGSTLFWPLAVVGLLTVITLAIAALGRIPCHEYIRIQARLLVVLWFLSPPLITWLVSQRRSFYADRYLAFAIPGVLLLLAFGLTRITRPPVRNLLFLGLVLTTIYGLVATYTDPAYKKDDWRGAAGYVTQNQQTDDAILLYTTHIKFPFDYYYPGPVTPQPISLNQERYPIESLVGNHQRAWVVYPYSRRPTHHPLQPTQSDGFWTQDPDRNPHLVDWLNRYQDNVIDYQHFQGVELWLVDLTEG
jgi:4-amino-4-deoxy-L-arabinose transferase-like glycosyltransferase